MVGSGIVANLRGEGRGEKAWWLVGWLLLQGVEGGGGGGGRQGVVGSGMIANLRGRGRSG